MAIGLTLTYITTKVPNFAYGSFVTVGIYASFTLYRVNSLNPYLSIPVAFLLGSFSSVVLYLGVMRTLTRRGASLVALMMATFAVDIAFVGIFGIYSDNLAQRFGIQDSQHFQALNGDFTFLGLPGVLYATPIALAATTFGIFVLLTFTKFGVAMRASVENPSLARILGINVEKVYVVAWFLAGGLAAMSGSFFVIYQPGGITTGSDKIVEIFASSVLGGLASVYGAALGGLIIGGSEILLTTVLIGLPPLVLFGVPVLTFGSDVSTYQPGIPLIIMVATLLLFPKGLVSVQWRRLLHVRALYRQGRALLVEYSVRLRLPFRRARK